MLSYYIYSTAVGGGTASTSTGGSGITSINGSTGSSITFAGVSGIFVVRQDDTIYVGYNGQPDLTASGFATYSNLYTSGYIRNVDFVSSGYQTRDQLTQSGYLRAADRLYPVDSRAVSGHILMNASGVWSVGSHSAPISQLHAKSGMFHDFIDMEVLQTLPAAPNENTIRTFGYIIGNEKIYGVQHGDGYLHNLFVDTSVVAKNLESSGIVKGQVVKVVGAVSNAPTIRLAGINDLNNDLNSILGVVSQDTASNGFGHIMMLGYVYFDTSRFSEGDSLYLSPTDPGGLTNIRPLNTAQIEIGTVVKSSPGNNGGVLVHISEVRNSSKGTISNTYNIGSGNAADTVSLGFKNSNTLNLSATPTASRTVTIPDDTGTIALLDNIKAGSGVHSIVVNGVDVYINTSGSTGGGVTLAQVQADLHTSGYIRNVDFVSSGFITKGEVASSGFATYAGLASSGFITKAEVASSGFATIDNLHTSGFIKNVDFLGSGLNEYQLEWNVTGPLVRTSGFDSARYVRKNSLISDVVVWARCPSGTVTFSLSSGAPGYRPLPIYSSNTKPTVTSGDYQCSIGKVPNTLEIPSGTLLYANIETVNANVLVKTGSLTFATVNTASGACMQVFLRG